MAADADLTILLEDWARGDESALQRLTPLIYPQLRTLARSQLRRNARPFTWQTTAVVNDLFLKLLSSRPPRLESRKHFFVLAARIIRLALIDHYRQAHSEKRDVQARVPLHDELTWVNAVSEDILDLDRALDELEDLDPQQAELFSMRFLLGCSAEETAELAGISKATVDRKVRLARAWLYLRLSESKADPISNTQ